MGKDQEHNAFQGKSIMRLDSFQTILSSFSKARRFFELWLNFFFFQDSFQPFSLDPCNSLTPTGVNNLMLANSGFSAGSTYFGGQKKKKIKLSSCGQSKASDAFATFSDIFHLKPPRRIQKPSYYVY